MGKLDRRDFIKKTSLSGAAIASSSLFTVNAESTKICKISLC
ncbi:MAG: twin-arginine translocation signal domain-containing protein [Cytophagales bacterium]